MNYTTDDKGLLTSYFGIPIRIEIPIYGYRIKSGIPPIYMNQASYGEFPETKGADGDPVDCYVGLFPDTDKVFIVNQRTKEGGFDEHKVMVGFLNRDDAAYAYSSATNGFIPLSIISCTPSQLIWWLRYGNKKQPVTINTFPLDTNSENAMEQNTYNWENPEVASAKVIYDIRHTDSDEQLLEPAIFDSVVDEIITNQDGEFCVLDSLVLPKMRLEKTAITFGRLFNRFGDDVLAVSKDGVQITEPFKKNGTTNIAMVFELTDGQTITCFMHNPDKTPDQLKSDDVLVAWRWMLNKKDITILVAPESGRDQNINEIGRRIMALAKKNMKRFADANTRRAQRIEDIRVRKESIETKRGILQDLVTQIDSIKQSRLEKAAQPTETVQLVIPQTEPEPVNELPADTGMNKEKTISKTEIAPEIIARFADAYIKTTNELNQTSDRVEKILNNEVKFDDPFSLALSPKKVASLICYEALNKKLNDNVGAVSCDYPDLRSDEWFDALEKSRFDVIKNYIDAENRLIRLSRICEKDDEAKPVSPPKNVETQPVEEDVIAQQSDTPEPTPAVSEVITPATEPVSEPLPLSEPEPKPEPEPEPITETTQEEIPKPVNVPESESTTESPAEPKTEALPETQVQANEKDIQFLNSIIAGKADIQAADFDAKLEEIARKYEGTGDEMMEKLLKDAVDAYANQTDAFDQASS